MLTGNVERDVVRISRYCSTQVAIISKIIPPYYDWFFGQLSSLETSESSLT